MYDSLAMLLPGSLAMQPCFRLRTGERLRTYKRALGKRSLQVMGKDPPHAEDQLQANNEDAQRSHGATVYGLGPLVTTLPGNDREHFRIGERSPRRMTHFCAMYTGSICLPNVRIHQHHCIEIAAHAQTLAKCVRAQEDYDQMRRTPGAGPGMQSVGMCD